MDGGPHELASKAHTHPSCEAFGAPCLLPSVPSYRLTLSYLPNPHPRPAAPRRLGPPPISIIISLGWYLQPPPPKHSPHHAQVHHPLDYARVVQRVGNEMDLTLVPLDDMLPAATVMVVTVTATTTSGGRRAGRQGGWGGWWAGWEG